jgi:uncharacterized membrane protein (DUF2068 family)
MTTPDPGITGWKAIFGLRAIAAFEATKGLLVLLAGSGLLFLVHRDLQDLADKIVWHFHLDPAGRESRILYRALTEATPGRLRLLAATAVAYAVFRFAEAWGLWNDKRWAELLGVVTGLIYVPFEIASFFRHPRLVPIVAFAMNIAIVWILARHLRARTQPSPVRDAPLRV